MRWLLLLFATSAMGQEVQCVTVPVDHKIVFVPWIIPVDQITWEWRFAKEPETAEPTDVIVYCDDGGLVISPSVCVKR